MSQRGSLGQHSQKGNYYSGHYAFFLLDRFFEVWFGTRGLFREWRRFSENRWTSAEEKGRTR